MDFKKVRTQKLYIYLSFPIDRQSNQSLFFFAAFHAVSCHFSPLNADPTIAYELFECG